MLALIGSAATRLRLLVQRLYHEVRHALNHLHVKPCSAASSSSQAEDVRQWQHWSGGAGLGAVVDQQDLPGPQGTKQLHLRRKEGPDEEELSTVSWHQPQDIVQGVTIIASQYCVCQRTIVLEVLLLALTLLILW